MHVNTILGAISHMEMPQLSQMQSQGQYQGTDYMEEIHESLVQETNNIQHSPSQPYRAYTTHEEGKSPSQPQ